MASAKSDQDMVKQITFTEQVSDLPANLNQSASKYDEETASRQGEKPWNIRLAPEIAAKITNESNGPIIPNNPIEELKQEPYKLPDGFSWDEVNILNDDQLHELYIFLNENYVEDDDNMFRFDYSMPFLRWALGVPGWDQKWNVAIRAKESGNMVGFISSVPGHIKVYDKQVLVVERNFLCVHKKLRRKRMAPALINEVTRRVNLQGVFQAAYTSGTVLPGIVSTCTYWHRSLNVEKLLEVKFSHLPQNTTVEQMKKFLKLPDTIQVPGFREMRNADVPRAWTLLSQYLKNFVLAPIFTQHEFEYLCQNRENIVSSFVVEKDGEITDFISYFHLSSTILQHPQHKKLNACYMYYYAASRTPLPDLVLDCLIQAQKSGIDVFNALELMDNRKFLEKLKFGIGDGDLQYYIDNWQCPQIYPEQIALVLQ